MRVQREMLCYFQGLKDPRHHEALFSLLPLKSGFTISNVQVDSGSLWQLLRRSGIVLRDAAGKPIPLEDFVRDHSLRTKWWAEILDMPKVMALKAADWQFHQMLTTDAHAVSFCFKKISAAASDKDDSTSASHTNVQDEASPTGPAKAATPHTSHPAPADGATPHTTHHMPSTTSPQAATGSQEPSTHSLRSTGAAQLRI